MAQSTAQVLLTIEGSKVEKFLEMLQNFDFGVLEAVRVAEKTDELLDLSEAARLDLQAAASDNDLSDAVPSENAIKQFRQWQHGA